MKKDIALFCTLILASMSFSAYGQELPSSTSVRVTAVAGTQTLLDSEVTVAACDSDGAGLMLITGYCAVRQLGLADNWSWWGSDAFLDALSGYASDYTQNWYWAWFSDLLLGQAALNKHELVSGEHLLLTYNTLPLRLVASSSTPVIGDVVRLHVEQFGYDAAWSPIWSPAASTTLFINGVVYFPDEQGVYDLSILDESPLLLHAQKSGFVESPQLIITPLPNVSPAPVVAPDQSSDGGSRSVEVAPVVPDEFYLDTAVHFLINFQKGDGSFGDDRYTDWATIALASAKGAGGAAEALSKAREYLRSDVLSRSARLTDYERRALALMAARVNPYDGAETNYIEAIIDGFDGEQFGEPGQDNDDIFALLVLLRAGYSHEDEMVRAAVASLLKRQKTEGDWVGIDLTAAALQVLPLVDDIAGVSEAISRAQAYLAAQQGANSDFGNAFSLSWVMQLDDVPGVKRNDMIAALADYQGEDGGVLTEADGDENRLWATAYAIPGFLGKSWPEIVKSFGRVVSEESEVVDEDKGVAKETAHQNEIDPVLREEVEIRALPTPAVLGEYIEVASEIDESRNEEVIADMDLEVDEVEVTSQKPEVDRGRSYLSTPWSLLALILILFVFLSKRRAR